MSFALYNQDRLRLEGPLQSTLSKQQQTSKCECFLVPVGKTVYYYQHDSEQLIQCAKCYVLHPFTTEKEESFSNRSMNETWVYAIRSKIADCMFDIGVHNKWGHAWKTIDSAVFQWFGALDSILSILNRQMNIFQNTQDATVIHVFIYLLTTLGWSALRNRLVLNSRQLMELNIVSKLQTTSFRDQIVNQVCANTLNGLFWLEYDYVHRGKEREIICKELHLKVRNNLWIEWGPSSPINEIAQCTSSCTCDISSTTCSWSKRLSLLALYVVPK